MSNLDKLTAYFERFPGIGGRQAKRLGGRRAADIRLVLHQRIARAALRVDQDDAILVGGNIHRRGTVTNDKGAIADHRIAKSPG